MIVFCMKDPGGTQAVVPVARKLMEGGLEVQFLATGVGARILANEEKLQFGGIEYLERILEMRPKMLVSSIDTGEMTVEVTRKAQAAGIPVAWIQDLWGNHVKPNWDGTVRPDYFFTLDKVGVRKVVESWPDFDQARIFPFGQPKFDLIAGIRLNPTLAAIKSSFNRRGVSVIIVAGQIDGMEECIVHLLDALDAVGKPVFVDFMHHGRCPEKMVEDFRQMYPRLCSGLATELADVDRNQRLLFGDVLFTMFSTDAVNASVAGKHVISCLLPGGRASFEKEGYSGEFFLTEAGYCLGVSSYDELFLALEKVITEPNKSHHRRLLTDGQSAARIAGKIVELVAG